MSTITISGTTAVILFASKVLQSRISSRFVDAHFGQNTHTTVLTASVSGFLSSQPLKSFTCVLDFFIDQHLNFCDAILGSDWNKECERASMLHLVQSVAPADKTLGVSLFPFNLDRIFLFFS